MGVLQRKISWNRTPQQTWSPGCSLQKLIPKEAFVAGRSKQQIQIREYEQKEKGKEKKNRKIRVLGGCLGKRWKKKEFDFFGVRFYQSLFSPFLRH